MLVGEFLQNGNEKVNRKFLKQWFDKFFTKSIFVRFFMNFSPKSRISVVCIHVPQPTFFYSAAFIFFIEFVSLGQVATVFDVKREKN